MMQKLKGRAGVSAEEAEGDVMSKEAIQAMMRYMPLRSLTSFMGLPREYLKI